MVTRRRTSYLRNDLKLMSVFIVGVIILVLALELPYRPIPETYLKANQLSGDAAGGQGGPGESPAGVPEDLEVVSRDGHTSEGYTTDEPFGLDQQFVYKVSIELTWQDDIGSNDEFRLTVEVNGTVAGEDSGTGGSLVVEVSDDGGGLGGDYVVEIEAVRCPGMAGPFPVDRDTGNDWHLKVMATVASATGDGGG